MVYEAGIPGLEETAVAVSPNIGLHGTAHSLRSFAAREAYCKTDGKRHI